MVRIKQRMEISASLGSLQKTTAAFFSWCADMAAIDDDSTLILLVLCGVVGSGKSTLADAISLSPDWVRVCQDVLGDRRSCERAVRQALSEVSSWPWL